jgi:hypothetical protein
VSITHCTLYNVQCTSLSWYAKSLRYYVYSLVVQDQNPKKLCVHWKGTLFSWKLNFSARSCYRVHTEWQWPLFDVHFIMMAKSAQPGGGEGCTPSPFHSIYHHEQGCVCAPAERADVLPLFLLYPYMYSVVAAFLAILLLNNCTLNGSC